MKCEIAIDSENTVTAVHSAIKNIKTTRDEEKNAIDELMNTVQPLPSAGP